VALAQLRCGWARLVGLLVVLAGAPVGRRFARPDDLTRRRTGRPVLPAGLPAGASGSRPHRTPTPYGPGPVAEPRPAPTRRTRREPSEAGLRRPSRRAPWEGAADR